MSTDKDIWQSIESRDLKALSDILHLDLRARLSLESRDEHERVGANTWQDRDSDEYAVPRTGPL